MLTSFTDVPYADIYQWMRREYCACKQQGDNPSKIGVQLTYDETGKSPTSFANVLISRISNGYYASKTIMCDMKRKRTVSKTMLFSPSNELVDVIDSERLTSIRCALMACIAFENFFTNAGKEFGDLSIGLIGVGEINTYTANALASIFGVRKFVLKGRPGANKNINLMPVKGRVAVEVVDEFHEMAECDAIFVATTETSQDRQAQIKDFPNPFGNRRLFVTQDTGCLLGESFRMRVPTYTDNVDQLNSHWNDCFPWDRYGLPKVREMSQINSSTESAAVYLYGMGFSDVVMACVDTGITQ